MTVRMTAIGKAVIHCHCPHRHHADHQDWNRAGPGSGTNSSRTPIAAPAPFSPSTNPTENPKTEIHGLRDIRSMGSLGIMYYHFERTHSLQGFPMPFRLLRALFAACLTFSFAFTAIGDDAELPEPAEAAEAEPAEGVEAKPPKTVEDVPANSAEAEPAEGVEGRLRAELQDAMTTKLELHGAWADLVRNEDGSFRVEMLVDSEPDTSKAQQAAIDAIVKKYLTSTQYTTQVIQLPFRELLTQLQDAIELQPLFGGAAVEDAYYVPGPDETLFVNLIGRVANDEQRTEMITACNELLRRLFGPLTERVQLAKADPPQDRFTGVRLVEPSEQMAAYVYDLGVAAFVRREYSQAYCYFTRARLDAPLVVELQYWRIVALIGIGNDERAALLLEDIIERTGLGGPGFTDILRSLERVQGPIRQRLVSMRNYLLTKCGTPPWEAGPVRLTQPQPARAALTLPAQRTAPRVGPAPACCR